MGATDWLTKKPRYLLGASILRILAGTAILLQYVSSYAQRRHLFGPNAIFPWDEYTRAEKAFRIYALDTSTLYFELVFHVGIVLALLWLAGKWTALTTPLNMIFWRGLHARNPEMWDGGDNSMYLVLTYVCFAEVGAYGLDGARKRVAIAASPVRVIVHNGALLAVKLQLCVVYAIAGLMKVQGEPWQNGTALYHAFGDHAYSLPPFTDVVSRSEIFGTVMGYFIVAFQVGFTFLVFLNRRTCRVAVTIGVLFHLGIGLFMGLVTFALFMIAADLAIVPDGDYRRLAEKWRSVADSIAERIGSTWARRLLARE